MCAVVERFTLPPIDIRTECALVHFGHGASSIPAPVRTSLNVFCGEAVMENSFCRSPSIQADAFLHSKQISRSIFFPSCFRRIMCRGEKHVAWPSLAATACSNSLINFWRSEASATGVLPSTTYP